MAFRASMPPPPPPAALPCSHTFSHQKRRRRAYFHLPHWTPSTCSILAGREGEPSSIPDLRPPAAAHASGPSDSTRVDPDAAQHSIRTPCLALPCFACAPDSPAFDLTPIIVDDVSATYLGGSRTQALGMRCQTAHPMSCRCRCAGSRDASGSRMWVVSIEFSNSEENKRGKSEDFDG
jgi:hypothetical protein